jgi:hypothetical protein
MASAPTHDSRTCKRALTKSTRRRPAARLRAGRRHFLDFRERADHESARRCRGHQCRTRAPPRLDGPLKRCLLQLPSARDKNAIIRKLAGALAASHEVDARKGTSTIDTAALKTLEATIAVRLAHMSDEQRAKVINTAIDILRTNNIGPEAEAEVRRILGV